MKSVNKPRYGDIAEQEQRAKDLAGLVTVRQATSEERQRFGINAWQKKNGRV